MNGADIERELNALREALQYALTSSDERIEALEAKCVLLSASLKQADDFLDMTNAQASKRLNQLHTDLRASEAKRTVAAMRLREVLTRDGLTLLCREALRDAISDVER